MTTQAFDSVLQLSSLDGNNGFRLDGVKAIDGSGESVTGLGDVNGDGIDDLLIGARFADPNGSNSGSSYVVFGRSSEFASEINLSILNGTNGFRLDGASAGDESGLSVSGMGDINGDGINDMLIGARRADYNGTDSGSVYVVFGRSSSFSSEINLSSLNGSNGFRLDGVSEGDGVGQSVSGAGDVNDDGIDDLLVGAFKAGTNSGQSGSTYVVFGRSSGFTSVVSLSSLDGSNGFRIDGVNEGDELGRSVSSAGDVNSDGIDDLLIGAPGAGFSRPNAGSTYVVFGRSSVFTSVIELSSLNGSNGFRIDGVAGFNFSGDGSGTSVSATGDVNGDGIDDLLIGAPSADPNGNSSGSSYVVFGRSSGFGSMIGLSSLDGSNGFRLDGIEEADFSGDSVNAAGDINGDGIGDLMIGASGADPNGDFSGSTYLVFGRSSSFSPVISLSSLNGSTGFRLDGLEGDFSGNSVSSAGDVNGDGIGDFLIGAFDADSNGTASGSTYVVFGINEVIDNIDDSFCIPIKTPADRVALVCL